MRRSPERTRVARTLLRWPQLELAGKADVSDATVAHLESGRRRPSMLIVSTMRDVFESASVEFLNGREPGVKPRARFAAASRDEWRCWT